MTCHAPVTRDVTRDTPRISGVTTRVSHATLTTPHRTTSLVTQVCGVFGCSIHPSVRPVRARRGVEWMGADAQIRRWFR